MREGHNLLAKLPGRRFGSHRHSRQRRWRAAAYGIVEKHDGRIEVDREPGQGATFTVCLPIRRPQQMGIRPTA
jgi:hypothetical protein